MDCIVREAVVIRVACVVVEDIACRHFSRNDRESAIREVVCSVGAAVELDWKEGFVVVQDDRKEASNLVGDVPRPGKVGKARRESSVGGRRNRCGCCCGNLARPMWSARILIGDELIIRRLVLTVEVRVTVDTFDTVIVVLMEGSVIVLVLWHLRVRVEVTFRLATA